MVRFLANVVGGDDFEGLGIDDVQFIGARSRHVNPLGITAQRALPGFRGRCRNNAPVAGKVSAVNDKVAKNPELINQAPYGDGWLFKLDVADAGSLKSLMTNAQYEEFLKTDAAHP